MTEIPIKIQTALAAHIDTDLLAELLAPILNDNRPGHFSRCDWCGGIIDGKIRANKKCCSKKCRRDSSRQTGIVGSVRRLKCGKTSYTIHGPENSLRPGDVISWGKVD